MRALDLLAAILVIAGAINWGLIGLFNFNLVSFITGAGAIGMNGLTRLIYVLVGLGGLYMAVAWKGIHRRAVEPAAPRVRHAA